jgi:drug/metabolite transporter (DMT)-like permease
VKPSPSFTLPPSLFSLPAAALLLAVFCVSCAAIWIRLAQAPALTIAADRMLVAVLALLLPTFLLGRRDLQALERADLVWLGLAGVGLAAHFGLWTVSLAYTSVASSVVFVSTHPVFVALAEWGWLGRRPRPIVWLGIGLTLFGSVIIGWGDLQLGGLALYGDLLAVGGALALVGYLLIGRRLRRRLGFLAYSLLVFTPCWLVLLLASLTLGASPLDFQPGDLPYLLALGLVSTLGGHAVFNWSLRHLSASLVAASFVAEPLGSALLAWLILREQAPAPTLLGGAVILIGIYLAARGE